MNNANYSIELSLIDDKVKFRAVSAQNQNHPVTFDYIPPIGTGDGFAGLELLTLCFSGCVSTAVLFLLRKEGIDIIDFKAHIYGFKREAPLSLEKIIYEVEIKSEKAEDRDISKVLELARTMSPVWSSLNPNIEVETRYKLVK